MDEDAFIGTTRQPISLLLNLLPHGSFSCWGPAIIFFKRQLSLSQWSHSPSWFNKKQIREDWRQCGFNHNHSYLASIWHQRSHCKHLQLSTENQGSLSHQPSVLNLAMVHQNICKGRHVNVLRQLSCLSMELCAEDALKELCILCSNIPWSQTSMPHLNSGWGWPSQHPLLFWFKKFHNKFYVFVAPAPKQVMVVH